MDKELTRPFSMRKGHSSISPPRIGDRQAHMRISKSKLVSQPGGDHYRLLRQFDCLPIFEGLAGDLTQIDQSQPFGAPIPDNSRQVDLPLKELPCNHLVTLVEVGDPQTTQRVGLCPPIGQIERDGERLFENLHRPGILLEDHVGVTKIPESAAMSTPITYLTGNPQLSTQTLDRRLRLSQRKVGHPDPTEGDTLVASVTNLSRQLQLLLKEAACRPHLTLSEVGHPKIAQRNGFNPVVTDLVGKVEGLTVVTPCKIERSGKIMGLPKPGAGISFAPAVTDRRGQAERLFVTVDGMVDLAQVSVGVAQRNQMSRRRPAAIECS